MIHVNIYIIPSALHANRGVLTSRSAKLAGSPPCVY